MTPTSTTEPPLLDDPHDLDAAAVERFAADGHVLVPGLASPEETADYRPLIERAALDTAWDKRPLEERDTYGKAFLQSFNLWRVDPAIARFTLARRFAHVAARLLGVDGVRLYHDQALCKEAGGGRTPWHQDQYYWPVDTDRMVTMWMPLVDVPDEVGSMTFVSGSHRLGDLAGQRISDSSDEQFAALIAARNLPTHTYGAVRAGDATFHGGWTVHCAPPNPTSLLRTVMTVIYMPVDVRVVEAPAHEAHDFDRKVWLAGTGWGEPCVSDRNPVLWTAGA